MACERQTCGLTNRICFRVADFLLQAVGRMAAGWYTHKGPHRKAVTREGQVLEAAQAVQLRQCRQVAACQGQTLQSRQRGSANGKLVRAGACANITQLGAPSLNQSGISSVLHTLSHELREGAGSAAAYVQSEASLLLVEWGMSTGQNSGEADSTKRSVANRAHQCIAHLELCSCPDARSAAE